MTDFIAEPADALSPLTLPVVGTDIVTVQRGGIPLKKVTVSDLFSGEIGLTVLTPSGGDDTAIIAAKSALGSVILTRGSFIISGTLTCAGHISMTSDARLTSVAASTVNFNGGFDAPIAWVLGANVTVTFDPRYTNQGYPEWWGALTNNAGFECQPAIQASVIACSATQLQAAKYYIGSRVLMDISGRILRGTSETQTDEGVTVTSQLCLTSTSAQGIQLGVDGNTQPTNLTEFVKLEDFTVVRVNGILNPTSGITNAPVGVALRWCVNCHISRVECLEHSFGYYFYGIVETYFQNCSSLRETAGINAGVNDFWAGFYGDYTAPLAANSGNASVYITQCRAFSNVGLGGSPTYSYNAGFEARGGFTDLYLNQFETGRTQYGIDVQGLTSSGIDLATEDLIISNCVLDTASLAALRIQTGGPYTAVTVAGNYLTGQSQAPGCHLLNLNGIVTLTGNQYGECGLLVESCTGISSYNNLHTFAVQAITITSSSNCRFVDCINTPNTALGDPAISLTGCTRIKLDCIIKGEGAGTYTSGINLVSTGNTFIEADCTSIDPGCIVGGSGNKLLYNAGQITSVGTFGTNCLAQGIMI